MSTINRSLRLKICAILYTSRWTYKICAALDLILAVLFAFHLSQTLRNILFATEHRPHLIPSVVVHHVLLDIAVGLYLALHLFPDLIDELERKISKYILPLVAGGAFAGFILLLVAGSASLHWLAYPILALLVLLEAECRVSAFLLLYPMLIVVSTIYELSVIICCNVSLTWLDFLSLFMLVHACYKGYLLLNLRPREIAFILGLISLSNIVTFLLMTAKIASLIILDVLLGVSLSKLLNTFALIICKVATGLALVKLFKPCLVSRSTYFPIK